MEWKPIETAPKDGRDILTFGNWHVMPAMFDRISKRWITGFEPALEAGGFKFKFDPTHWMELPEPPTE